MNGDSKDIGLIGIGLLGAAIAERLLQAGFSVRGFDTNADRLEAFANLGGTAVAELTDVATCSRIVLSLPDSNISDRVIAELQPRLQTGTVVIDTATGEPAQMAAIAERLAADGIAYMDACIGGSSEQCRAGEVIVIAGGNAAEVESCGDLFAAFAKSVFHVGPAGAGARMKLVLNLVLGLNRAVLAEGLSLAKRLDLDPAAALTILKSGPAYSTVMDTKGEKMLTGDFTPQARLAQHLKDVKLIRKTGAESAAALPFSELHEQLLEQLACNGYIDADNAAIIAAFE